jgi:hypothetical protein
MKRLLHTVALVALTIGYAAKALIQALKEASHRLEKKRIEGLFLASLASWRLNLYF